MANVSQLQPISTPQVQTSSIEASEKDADFLALRLLNKRARLRLSPEPLDLPGKASLFAVANSKGWFAAVIRDASNASVLILSPLAHLRSALVSNSDEDEQPFSPQKRVPINGAHPHILTFAFNDTRILLGLLDGSIQVYDIDHLLSIGDAPVHPLHVFTTSSSPALLSIQPNPGDIPELVAVLRNCTNTPGSLVVELFDVQNLISSGGWVAGSSPSTTPTSISWSPKGKQLALGLQSGDIVTFSPTATATPKSSIPRPPSANNMSVISMHWLSTSSFHTIYAPPGQLAPDVEQGHFHISMDSKNNSAQNLKFNNPYLPFPGLRPPGEFLVCLRGWDPSKVLLFIGDSTSSDIGLIGSVASDSGEIWHNLSLEETSTPSLPLDKDQNDTILLGMDVDLTSSESYRHSTASGEALELPAHPIIYVYASDGTILGWHVLNVTGAPYPGLVPSTSVPSAPPVPSSMVRELSTDMQTTPTISTPPTEVSPTVAPSSVFGQPSTFGAQGSAFGQPSAFGSGVGQQSTAVFTKVPSFGQPSTAPAFGSTSSPSPFGQPTISTFGSTAPSLGFGAFTSTGPSKFGQTTVGFGGPPQVTPTQPPSISVPEESMAADDAPSFGGFGLGAANSQDADSKPSIFGKINTPVSSDQQSTSSSMIKPGTGFGAFAGFDQKSTFTKPSAFSNTQQGTSTFGATAFQTNAESAPSTSFSNVSSFGTGQTASGPSTPAFGQPAFGQSSFGQPQTVFGKTSFGFSQATTSTNASTGGAFSSFASSTQSAFGAVAAKSGPSAKPAWAATDSSRPVETSPARGLLAQSAESAELKTPSAIPVKTTTTTPPLSAPLTPSTASRFAVRESIARDDDSRSPSPILNQLTTTAGAFSNLQTTPSAFVKPPSGIFGELPKDSPFFAPKLAESNPVTAFALSTTPTTPTSAPPKAGSAPPAFGAPSFPAGGAFKSAFAPAVAGGAPVQPISVPGGGNPFGGFSSGGFAAFSSGGSKSFSDLLRSGGEDKASSKAAGPSEATPTKPAQELLQPPVSTTPASTPIKEPPRTSATPPEPAEVEKEKEQSKVEAKPSEVSVDIKEEQAAEPALVQAPSLESISSSTSSSYVKVSAEEEGEVTEEGTRHEPGLQDEEASFLSDVPSESESEEEEEEEEEEEDLSEVADEEETEQHVQKPVDATEIPLPITPAFPRSPSTTPKAEHPKIRVSVSPPPLTPSPSSVPRVSPVPDIGSTPPGSPGSPVKDTASASAQMPVPAAKGSPPPASPFTLAPRTNNTRPARSSPLAGTPLVLEGEGEKPALVAKSAPPTMVAQPAAPKEPFGQWTTPPLAYPAEGESSFPKGFSIFSAAGDKPATSPFALAPTRAAGEKPTSIFAAATTPAAGEKPEPIAGTFTTAAGGKTTSIFAPAPTAGEKPTSIFATATTPPTGEKPVSIFAPATTLPTGEKPALSISPPLTTPAPKSLSGFGFADKAPTVTIAPTAVPLFAPAATANTWGPTPKAPQSLFGGQPSMFGVKAGPTPPLPTSPSPFMAPSILSTSPVPSLTPPPPKIPAPSPSPAPEQGMQAECTLLLDTIVKELENLRQLATAASVKLGELKKVSGVRHQKVDLGDSRKWVFGDIEEFGRVLVDVQTDVKELKLQRVSLRKALKELDSNILKVNTRKEEIVRFNKAKTDAEFAKVLKIRTLAPEYSETQSQLRRNIRVIRDRVQKLEDHLQSSKKRINELRTGRPVIRPPSLDTVNRTFRNIDVAIDQQKQDVSQLRRRMAKLEISGGAGARGDQLTISTSCSSKRPLCVTPNVATTTAAALNAERSARRLKKALLASRQQPLLNTTVVPSSVPTSFRTPQKAPVVQPTAKSGSSEYAFALPSTPMMSFPSSLPSWSPPPPKEFGSPGTVAGSPPLSSSVFDVSPSARTYRGAAKHHQKPIVLKKSGNASTSPGGPTASMSTVTQTQMTLTTQTTQTAVSMFEWESVQPVKPVSSLPFALRPA